MTDKRPRIDLEKSLAELEEIVDQLESGDLPLDRRLLFVAELTGHEWWVVSVTLRRWSGRTSALQAARDLYAATNPKMVAGRGVAPRCGSL